MQRLATAISDEDWPNALEIALEAWRANRSPDVARLIDLLGLQIRTPLGEHDLQQTWIERAVPYDAAMVSPLLAHVTVRMRGSDGTWARLCERWATSDLVTALATEPGLPQHRNWFERLLAIMTWPDDPRISSVLAEWLTGHEVFVRSPAFDVIYGAIAERLVALADPRILPQLAAFLADSAPGFRNQRELVARVHAALVSQVPGLVDEQAISTAIAELVARDADCSAMWRAGQPRDLVQRAVLGDALVAIGDPRGELITLQLAIEREPAADPARDPRVKRVTKLLDGWWDHWLGSALAALIVRDGTVFRNGMLEVIRVGYPTTPQRAWVAARGHRELASVQTVLVGRVPAIEYARFVTSLPQLSTLEVDQPETMRELARIGTALPIETLVYVQAAALAGTVAPSVETFRMIGPIAPHLERIVLAPERIADELVDLVAALPEIFPRLAAIELPAPSRVAARALTAQFASVPLVTIR